MPDQPLSRSEPPPITLTWCPVCERTDRFQPLRERHFNESKLCAGKPIQVRYYPHRQRAPRGANPRPGAGI